MSLLSIIQGVCGRLSLAQPPAVVGSTDSQVLQLLALAQEEGKALARRYPWQALTEEQTFVTTATAVQATAVPADFDRFVPNSVFNRTTRRGVLGPITPQQWQAIMAQPVSSKVYLAFRRRTGQYLIIPTPPAGQTIAYEYLSVNWVLGGASQTTPAAAYAADTDLSYLSEELITLGVRWRFLQAKGLDYAEAMNTYERELEKAMARDGGASALTLTPQPIDPSRINIPDGNYGV